MDGGPVEVRSKDLENQKIRINFEARCNTEPKFIRQQVKKTNARHYERVTWGILRYDTCAVCGGGPSLEASLDALRKWPGDIFGINDTAGYLSDNGIPCYMYGIDCEANKPWKSGPLVKGAIFATRVSQIQMRQFSRKKVRVFDMAEEDGIRGIEGGPTAVCRAPHLFLRTGYRGICFFGIDGSFYDKTHVTGRQEVAFSNMMIVRVNEIEYLTNAAFYLQNQFIVDVITKYPKFLFNCSGGLIEAMLTYPNDWTVVAVADDLRKSYQKLGVNAWNKEHPTSNVKFWHPNPTIGQETKPPSFVAVGEVPESEKDQWQQQRIS